MKKHIIIVLLLALCVWSITSVLEVKAQEEEEISYQELEVETPKLLPNNPFHFIKSWGWGIRRVLTFDSVKRAELELEITNEQAAEIKRLEETDPDNAKSIERAMDNYQQNTELLKNRLEILKETSENPNVDKLLDKLIDRSLKHQRLFDNLKLKFENRPALIKKLEDIQNRVDDVIVKIPEKFEDALKFKERVQKIIEGQPQRMFKELRAMEFIDRLEEKLPEIQKEHLQNLKENLIFKFEDKIQNWRDTNENELLEESEERVLKMIDRAKSLISEVEKILSGNLDGDVGDEVIKSVKELIETAKKHLANSEAALNNDKIGEAFGQANSAVSTASNALRKIQRSDEDEDEEVACPLIAPSCPTGEKAMESDEKDEKGCSVLKCAQFCGGIANIKCQESYFCKLGGKFDGNYPDAGGRCVKKDDSPKPVCIQVITPAISLDGVCKDFSTPCDVPANWKKIHQCVPFNENSPFGISEPGGEVKNRWEDNTNQLSDLNVHWAGAQGRATGISWGDTQASKNSPYNWGVNDNTVKLLQEKNINYFTIIFSVASWDLESCYAPSQLKKKPSGFYTAKLPCDIESYGEFIEAVVERYDGDGKNDMPDLKSPITYWMSISEPDNPGDWNDTAENYGVLLKTMYGAIKNAAPNAKLVVHGAAGAIGGGIGAYNSPDGFFYKAFVKLKQLSPIEIEKYKDLVWGFHYTTNAGTYLMSEEIINAMNNMTQSLGYGIFPVWVTETGTFSGTVSQGQIGMSISQNEKQQASELLKRFVFNMGNGVKKVFWARLIDSSWEMGPFKGVGLLKLDETKKLSYCTYKKMVEILEGSDWENIETVVENSKMYPNVYVYKFTKRGKPIWVVWNDNSESQSVTISGITSSQVKITEAIPKYESGKEITDYNTAFNTETKSVSAGKITIILKDKPIFVE